MNEPHCSRIRADSEIAAAARARPPVLRRTNSPRDDDVACARPAGASPAAHVRPTTFPPAVDGAPAPLIALSAATTPIRIHRTIARGLDAKSPRRAGSAVRDRRGSCGRAANIPIAAATCTPHRGRGSRLRARPSSAIAGAKKCSGRNDCAGRRCA
jgi:hypothetical protein